MLLLSVIMRLKSVYCIRGDSLFITHQLPKGLQVDEAVILGKEKSGQSEQQTTMTQSTQNNPLSVKTSFFEIAPPKTCVIA